MLSLRRPLRPSSVAPPAPAGAASLDVAGLGKRFGATEVLRGVDLAVAPGELVALLGPSGCGKTTLLRCLAGLERPDAGQIWLGGRLLAGPDGAWVAPERRRIGMVFQDAALFPHLTVAANVGYGLARGERRGPRVGEALRLVGLEDIGGRMPATLSGGQQQRVALARALVTRPGAILLDEPFAALDAPLRVQLRAEVRSLLTALGTTAVFVTHDQEEAFQMGDRVAVMLDGSIAQVGSPADLYELPRSQAVAEFIGDANLIAGDGAGGTAFTALGEVPLAEERHGPVRVMVRPEVVHCTSGGDALVEDVDYYGHDAVYRLRLADGQRVCSRTLGMPVFTPGDLVSATFSGVAAVAYPDDLREILSKA
jgi:iron(III) transport system ATP-binding protein